MKITWTCSILFDFGFHLYAHVISLLSQLEYLSLHELCETAFTVCLKRKKESSWVLWFAVKKVSYQSVKVFRWPKESLQMFWPSFRGWSFPKPKMTSNFFPSQKWYQMSSLILELLIANLCLPPSLLKS